jgi:hypothetical protein
MFLGFWLVNIIKVLNRISGHVQSIDPALPPAS